MSFDWNHARSFLVSAQEGSFSAAARVLGTSQPTVGRHVAALEAELGVTLFARVGSRLELTDAGTDLLPPVRAMSEAADGVSLTAAGQSTSVEGSVCITSSEAIAAFLLPPIVDRLRRVHPGIEIEILAANDIRDLQRREADIAIRNVRPTQPELFSRRVRDADGYLYATPSYVARVGPFETARDLQRAEIFAFDKTDLMIEGLKHFGLELSRSQFPVTIANHLVQWSMCTQGVGVCAMMAEVGDPEPRVQRVFPQVQLPVQMWLVSHRELRTSRRIRLVFDHLVDALS